MTLDIACAADSRYVGHSAAMLHSALTAGGEDIVVHYLHDRRLPRGAMSKLSRMFERTDAQVRFYEMRDDRLAKLPMTTFGPAMWYRVALPELLPEIPKILYLDIDTLVLDRLTPLWELDLNDCYLAAVTNVSMEFDIHRPGELGLGLFQYFNSGVLMMNLELMRRDDFSGRLIDCVRTRASALVWPDQDALNLMAAHKRLELHPRWNCMNSFWASPRVAAAMFGEQALAEAVRAPAIRHFEGPGQNKPWHRLHEPQGQRLYREHRVATPWPSYRIEGGPPQSLLRRIGTNALHRVGRHVRSAR